MSLWRKLAYGLAEDMLVLSEPNNRNMSAVKITYQLNVRCDLCLWNEEYKIVLQSCPLLLRTAFSLEGSDVLKKNWHRYTQTHINTDTHKDTHTHTDTHSHTHTHTHARAHALTYVHTHASAHAHTHILPTNIDHHTAEFLKTMSQLCDGIQCRLTARTAGSTEGEILASELWKKQTDQVKHRRE